MPDFNNQSSESQLVPLLIGFNGEWWDDQEIDRFSLGTQIPAVNISEGIKHYSVDMAVPGFERADFTIEVSQEVMSITTEKEELEVMDPVTRREYRFTSFSRSFTIPKEIEVNEITAAYSRGILHIHLPKSAVPENIPFRLIPVK